MRHSFFESELVLYFPADLGELRKLVDTVSSTAPRASAPPIVKALPPQPVGAPRVTVTGVQFMPRRGRYDEDRGPAAGPPSAGTESSGRVPDSWLIGLSKRFKESVAKTDRKRQGRILEAVVSLTEDPMKVVGDTVKPLSEDKKGYWRRRVGDYRLTYHPDPDSGLITLVDFEARGSAYA
jgi:mRNA-degrading endonuclease RelE of RelBE toxin-antitoxin system